MRIIIINFKAALSPPAIKTEARNYGGDLATSQRDASIICNIIILVEGKKIASKVEAIYILHININLET